MAELDDEDAMVASELCAGENPVRSIVSSSRNGLQGTLRLITYVSDVVVLVRGKVLSYQVLIK